MKLYLNHTERYPVEQLQMQLFASEPSEFVTAPFAAGENGAVSNRRRRSFMDELSFEAYGTIIQEQTGKIYGQSVNTVESIDK